MPLFCVVWNIGRPITAVCGADNSSFPLDRRNISYVSRFAIQNPPCRQVLGSGVSRLDPANALFQSVIFCCQSLNENAAFITTMVGRRLLLLHRTFRFVSGPQQQGGSVSADPPMSLLTSKSEHGKSSHTHCERDAALSFLILNQPVFKHLLRRPVPAFAAFINRIAISYLVLVLSTSPS